MISLQQRKSPVFEFSIPHTTGTAFTTHVFNHNLNSNDVTVDSFIHSWVSGGKVRALDFYRESIYYGYSFHAIDENSANIFTYSFAAGVTLTGYISFRTI